MRKKKGKVLSQKSKRLTIQGAVLSFLFLAIFGTLVATNVIKNKERSFEAQLVNSKVEEFREKMTPEDEEEGELTVLINEIDNLRMRQDELEKTNKKLQKTVDELKTSSRSGVNRSAKSTETKKTIQTSASATSTSTYKKEKWIWSTYNVSAYCACVQCCGKTNGITASGAKAKAGVTIAAGKSYPFGTKIEIKGYGTYIVQDRGGAISDNHIDMFFNSHSEALKFGRRNLQARIVE